MVFGYTVVDTELGEVKVLQEFTVIIGRDSESGWLVGSVAELPGCYSQAPDLAMLQSNIQKAIQV